jgi:hypothetical protein
MNPKADGFPSLAGRRIPVVSASSFPRLLVCAVKQRLDLFDTVTNDLRAFPHVWAWSCGRPLEWSRQDDRQANGLVGA